MFAFVIATFLICWFPYHAYFLYSYHNPEVELPILSVYSLVFVILFVTNNLHHPGPPTAPLCLLLPQLWGGAVFLIWWFIKRIFYSYQTIFITYRCFSPVMSWCHGIGFVISMLDIFYTTNVNASFSAISKSKTSSKCSPHICPIPSNLRCTQIMRSPHIKNAFMFFYWLAMVSFFIYIAYHFLEIFWSERSVLPFTLDKKR